MPVGDAHLRIVILAGGIGSRFWPASTPSRPKPLLVLGATDEPLIARTVRRGLSLVPPERLSVLTGESLVGPILEAVPELGPGNFLIEPRARGTAPALAWAAQRIHREDPEAVLVSLHADHVIRPEGAFTALIARAAALARAEDRLFTIAVSPTRAETGYGYIRPGSPIRTGNSTGTGGALDAFEVGAFVEKPDRGVAERYISEGCLWNSGIFLFPVARFLEEIRSHAPEIGAFLHHLERGNDEAFFDAVATISVDEAVLERSGRVGAVRADFEWDDVGSWEALTRTRPADDAGNHVMGEVHAVDSRGCVAWAEDGPIVLFGVDDLVVVRSGNVVLVSSRARTSDLKWLLPQLPGRLRDPGNEPAVKPQTGKRGRRSPSEGSGG
ncbi:MAG: mannose-1-phosphate guanylyltransferase [Gemmatimonadetes bacterium]|nr:mannose-1-phosphate guanylyltransferase [Gemmatimonadota bacterium]